MSETSDLLAQYLAALADAQQSAKRELLAAIPTLRGLGLQQVRIDYSGGGDSGQADSVVTTPNISLPTELEELLKDKAYELAPGGFENNDGGFGNVAIDVEAEEITHEHADYYTEVQHAPTVVFSLDNPAGEEQED